MSATKESQAEHGHGVKRAASPELGSSSWEAADLGNEERKQKFLRLMGAGKITKKLSFIRRAFVDHDHPFCQACSHLKNLKPEVHGKMDLTRKNILDALLLEITDQLHILEQLDEDKEEHTRDSLEPESSEDSESDSDSEQEESAEQEQLAEKHSDVEDRQPKKDGKSNYKMMFVKSSGT